MRVLIVDDSQQHKLHKTLAALIKKILGEIKEDTAIEDPLKLVIRGTNELAEFIHDGCTIQLNDPQHRYINQQSKRSFENLDLIIIIGDLQKTPAPWDHSIYQVHTLVRQSMLYQKSIIGIGLGAMILGMYASTKLPFNHKYEMIDQIKNVQFNQQHQQEISTKYKRIIIDQDSGMYYNVDDYAQKVHSIGDFQFTFNHSKKRHFDLALSRHSMRLRPNEKLAQVRKIHIQHFSINANIKSHFRVQSTNNTLYQLNEVGQANFITIAEDSLTKQPLMFELRPCSFGILFDIYQDESLSILQNVLKYYLQLSVTNRLNQTMMNPMDTYGASEVSVSLHNTTINTKHLFNNSSRNNFTATAMGNFSELLSDYSTHNSKMAVYNHHPNTTMKNAPSQQTIYKLPKNSSRLHTLRKSANIVQAVKTETEKSRQNLTSNNHQDVRMSIDSNLLKYLYPVTTKQQMLKDENSTNRKHSLTSSKAYAQVSLREKSTRVQSTQGRIKQMLQTSKIIDNDQFLLSSLSTTIQQLPDSPKILAPKTICFENQYQSIEHHNIQKPTMSLRLRGRSIDPIQTTSTEYLDNNTTAIEGKKHKIQMSSPVNRLFKRYKEFQTLNSTSIYDQPESTFVSSSIKSMTFQERLNKEGYRSTIDKTKWVSRNDFKGHVGKASTGQGFDQEPYNTTYVTRAPSDPPITHKFRESSPKKWLFGKFKLC